MKRRNFLSSMGIIPLSILQSNYLRSSVFEEEKKPQGDYKYMSYKGLVMSGYQGWFNAPDDGAGRGWNHYQKDGLFEPGHCSIDLWPDMNDYKVKYKTSFTHADGSPSYIFSSYDESTVNLHFQWMQHYAIDGVFMQRFIVTLKSLEGANQTTKVFSSAIKAARQYGRAICVMYDLSGMQAADYKILIDDWKKLVDRYHLKQKNVYENYLFHCQKPLVAVWGVGFNDGRKYGFDEVQKIIDFLKNDPTYGGCSVMLGVPTWWRELQYDTLPDPRLHEIIREADIVQPWFVGRYNEQTYPQFKKRIIEDIAWCRKAGIDYVPVAYPGFSWHNMRPSDPINAIPRNKGSFLWKQLSGDIESGAEMIYVAMFDEIDEATAIFKCSKYPPDGASRFVAYNKDVPSDHYMWLTGQAAGMLKGTVPFQRDVPYRTY